MNEEKRKYLTDLAEKLYKEFLKDETICGLTSLFKQNKIGSKTGGHIRKILYEKYGKENVNKISFKRTSVNSHRVRSKESYQHSEEWNKNISEGNKKKWNEDDGSRRELSKQLVLEYCNPKCQTEEAKKNRVKSRSWYKHSKETIDKIRNSQIGRKLSESHKIKLRTPKKRKRVGFNHSEKTKQKLSEITKNQWKSGIHKPKYKSKGHVEILNILSKLGYDTQDEFLVNGRPYDVFVKDKNLLIEFNGTFWHRDPRIEKYKTDPISPSIWKNDLEKVDNAKREGYDVKVIWQYDWENCLNKEDLIKSLL